MTTKPASAFIVMAHIDGDTLQNLLGSGDHLGISECVELFAPIANCLDYIHGQGVIHRNVKPANIIVKRPRGAALSDFSLAQTRTPSKFILPARVAGTPTFMSPEQARGEAVDGRSDLFSFGCILNSAIRLLLRCDLGVERLLIEPSGRLKFCCWCGASRIVLTTNSRCHRSPVRNWLWGDHNMALEELHSHDVGERLELRAKRQVLLRRTLHPESMSRGRRLSP